MSFLSKIFNLNRHDALPDGSQEWRNSDGQLNRGDDKPAYIGSDGTKKWYQNGQLHRVLGPAVVRADGSAEWWIKGDRLNAGEIKFLQKQVKRVMQQRQALAACALGLASTLR